MPDGHLNADLGQYLAAAGLNAPPPPIGSDPLVGGPTAMEQLLRVLGLAANADDPIDNAEAWDEHLSRDYETREAAGTFAAQDQDGTAAMAQQLPQLASGLAGVFTGALQPLAQIPQQLSQGAQQAAQAAFGVFGQGVFGQGGALPLDGRDSWVTPEDAENGFSADDFGDQSAAADFDAGDMGPVIPGGPAGLGATTPSAALGPPPVPSASTAPAAAPPTPAATTPAAPTRPPAPAAGMAGLPMVPPGALNAAGNTDAKSDPGPTKRVSVPAVRNGAPVQGRITTPPTPVPVVRTPEVKPAVTRRILPPPPSGS